MPFKSEIRDARRSKARRYGSVSRARIHTLDRLAAERARDAARAAERRAKELAA